MGPWGGRGGGGQGHVEQGAGGVNYLLWKQTSVKMMSAATLAAPVVSPVGWVISRMCGVAKGGDMCGSGRGGEICGAVGGSTCDGSKPQ